jgi:hypothetical protein
MHQPRHVLEAHVAGKQLLVVEHADAAWPYHAVPFECEVHFLDAVLLRARAELGFRAEGAAAEENALRGVHRAIIASHVWSLPGRPVDRGLLSRV